LAKQNIFNKLQAPQRTHAKGRAHLVTCRRILTFHATSYAARRRTGTFPGALGTQAGSGNRKIQMF